MSWLATVLVIYVFLACILSSVFSVQTASNIIVRSCITAWKPIFTILRHCGSQIYQIDMSGAWAHVKPVMAKLLEWKMFEDEEQTSRNPTTTTSTPTGPSSDMTRTQITDKQHPVDDKADTHLVRCFGIAATGPCGHKKKLPLHERFYLCKAHSGQADWIQRRRRE